MGGSDAYTNIVYVTTQEHLILHKCLYLLNRDEHPDLIFAVEAFYERHRHLRPKGKLPSWVRRAAHFRRQQIYRTINKSLKQVNGFEGNADEYPDDSTN